jgi:predicted transcriptional regulator/GTPase SAR1 family protein
MKINWAQFGLKTNPYDTRPLIEGGEVPIHKAFIGRQKEIQYLDKLFNYEKRSCMTVCGNVGVGKTSLVNFYKYVWKNRQREQSLFSFRREIEANTYLLNKKNFLLEIIGSVITEIQLIDPDIIRSNNVLLKLSKLIDITQTVSYTGGVQVLGVGGEFGLEKVDSQPYTLPVATIEGYFYELIKTIQTVKINGILYEGLIVHVNNFDTVLYEKETTKDVIKFFHEIRDILQVNNVFYLFVGPKDFYQKIVNPHTRIKGVFNQTPILVDSLSKTEVREAIQERIALLKSADVSTSINPFEKEVVFELYDLYQGDIRLIFNALNTILRENVERLPKTMSVDEALFILAHERWNSIEMYNITAEQKEVLKILVKLDKPVSQKEIAELMNKAQTNVSGYYFKPLRDLGIIEQIENTGDGRIKYWYLSKSYLPLKFLLQSQSKIRTTLAQASGQLRLLE